MQLKTGFGKVLWNGLYVSILWYNLTFGCHLLSMCCLEGSRVNFKYRLHQESVPKVLHPQILYVEKYVTADDAIPSVRIPDGARIICIIVKYITYMYRAFYDLLFVLIWWTVLSWPHYHRYHVISNPPPPTPPLLVVVRGEGREGGDKPGTRQEEGISVRAIARRN